jgi:hypothetical protein
MKLREASGSDHGGAWGGGDEVAAMEELNGSLGTRGGKRRWPWQPWRNSGRRVTTTMEELEEVGMRSQRRRGRGGARGDGDGETRVTAMIATTERR